MARSLELVVDTALQGQAQTSRNADRKGENGNVWEGARKPKRGETKRNEHRECVLFIGTRFSNLYTAVDTPAEARDVVHDVCALV